MAVSITKIQFLTNRNSDHPIYYCHGNDADHHPILEVISDNNSIYICGRELLFKIKRNPQTKNRVDIYMPIASANALGHELMAASQGYNPLPWRESNASPHSAATGRMALPDIIWSKFAKAKSAIATTNSGTYLSKSDPYVNIDLETPHDTFIMMNDTEIHIGISLDSPTGIYDPNRTQPVNVPENELQRGTGERNPISKVSGNFTLEFSKQVAAGLGQLLSGVKV